jgi:polyferredoxin
VTACPIGVIQHFVGLREVPWYVLGVVALAGSIGGRLACGWFCPFGWFQELMHKLPVPKWRIRPRRRAHWLIVLVGSVAFVFGAWLFLPVAVQAPALFGLYLVAGFVAFAILGFSSAFSVVGVVLIVALLTADTWFCKLCPAGMLEGGIPWIVIDANLRTLIGPLYGLKLILLVLFLGWMAVTRRPFCRWICPLGAVWSPFNRLSAVRLAVDNDLCILCDRCQKVCPVDIRIYQDANAGACVRCAKCIGECPVSCISVEPIR